MDNRSLMPISIPIGEKCWEENGLEECERLGWYEDENRVRLNCTIITVHGELASVSEETYTIELTKDRDLLLYVWHGYPFRYKERIMHVILNEESAELLRRRIEAVETLEEFWDLFEELRDRLGHCSEKKGAICIEKAHYYKIQV